MRALPAMLAGWIGDPRPHSDPLNFAVERERTAVFTLAAGIRAAGAVAIFIQVLCCWLVTHDPGWFVYLLPLALYTNAALLVLVFRTRGPVQALTWGAAVLDVCGVYVMQLKTMPVSPYPAGVAGFSLGLFALVLVLSSMSMKRGASLVVAAAASLCQCRLMAAADVSPASMFIAVTTLFLVAWATHAGIDRVHLLAARVVTTEAARLAESRRADELTRARDQIRAMLEEAETRNIDLLHAQQDRDDLAHLLVHDLRNPLTTLTMSLSSLERHLQRDGAEERWQGVVARSLQSTRRLGGMVSDLLDLAKLEEGRLQPQRSLVRLGELVPDGWIENGDIAPEFTAKRLLDLPRELELLVDRGLITRVLENLLGNASRYTKPENRILVRARRVGSEIIIGVHNDGPPITLELKAKLFTRFSRGSHESQRGWGLGLYFCKLAVEAHRGRIGIEDVPGWPVSFVVRLPSGGPA